MTKNVRNSKIKLLMSILLVVSFSEFLAAEKCSSDGRYLVSCLSIMDKMTMAAEIKLSFKKPQDNNLVVETRLLLKQHEGYGLTKYELQLNPRRIPETIKQPLSLCRISIWDIGKDNDSEKDLLNNIAQKSCTFYIQTKPTVPAIALLPNWYNYIEPHYWPGTDFQITPTPRQKTIWWECEYDPVLFADIQTIIRKSDKIDLEEKK